MAINQLFKIKPPFNFILQIALLYGITLDNLSKKSTFTKQELVKLDIVNKIEEIKDKLDNFYLKCKSKIYLNEINVTKCVTILRQLLKLYNYKIQSSEHYNNSKKYIVYTIILNENKPLQNNGIIQFD